MLIFLALAFAVGLVAQFFEYWYITVPIALAIVALAIAGQNAAKKREAATQGKAQVIDSTATRSTQEKPPSASPAVLAPEPSPSQGQANGHDSSSEQSPAFIADELAKLAQLRDTGVLTEEEFADAKRWLLGKGP